MKKDTKLFKAATHGTVMGRHVVDKDEGSIRFDWPGVRIDFEGVTATTMVGVVIPKTSGSILGYRVSHLEDGEEEIVFPKWPSQEYVLAENLDPNKAYHVSIWKRDDPALVKILGIYGDVTMQMTPTKQEEPTFHLEFVGDSDTVGFGVQGKKSGILQHVVLEAWNSRNVRTKTNVHKSWAHLVAKSMDNASYSVIAWSAYGAKHSVMESNNMLDIYPRVLATKRTPKATSVQDAQDLLGPIPNAVVLYIGQNDQTSLKDSWGNTETLLQEAFVQLVQLIRSLRPLPIPIVVVVPFPDCMVACATSERERRNTCLVQARVWKSTMEQLGGSKQGLYVVENDHSPPIAKLNSKEDFGMCLHWNESGQAKFAAGLIPKLNEILQQHEENMKQQQEN